MDGLLSVIVPAYNEEAMILNTAATISSILESEAIPYEILFVNDGSKDKTWENITNASRLNRNVKGICFSKNFGKESAMIAGLANAIGDCAVLIDCDLQHPPEKIVEMYRLWQDGYEVVEGVKASRGKESFMHKLSAKCFYGLISKAVNIDMSRASDFKLLDRKAIDALLHLKEKNAFFRALSSWVGYKSTQIEFHVQERTAGESKWSTKSLVKYAVTNITSFSSAPMQIVTILGIIMLIISVALGCVALVQKIIGYAQPGFTTVIIIELFIGSVVMMSIGIVGYYIAKMYDEIKGRPRFIISQSVGKEFDDVTKIG